VNAAAGLSLLDHALHVFGTEFNRSEMSMVRTTHEPNVLNARLTTLRNRLPVMILEA
jgi:hypothetical protein